MTITDILLRCMLDMGLSESGALFHVEKIAAGVARDLERERRDKAIRELWPKIGEADVASKIAERFGVGRSTAYRALKKIPRNADSWDGQKIV